MISKTLLLSLSLLTTTNALAEITTQQYQPSGCVEASFMVDSNGKASDIKFSKHIPENMFLEQAFTNIKNMTHSTKNLNERKNIYLKFETDNSWPMPFECLKGKKALEEMEKINNQFLNEAKFSQIKEAVDARFFQTIYDSIKVETSEIKTNRSNGKYSATTTVKWSSDPDKADNFINNYYKPVYATTVKNSLQALSIVRSDKVETPPAYSDELLNYIGQRKITISVKTGDKTKEIYIGAPIKGTGFCSGQIANKENFNSYCLTYSNSKGKVIQFDNLSEDEAKNIQITTELSITNSFLRKN